MRGKVMSEVIISQRPEYIEGRKSYHKNKGEFICPYVKSSTQFDLFERGWVQALKSSEVTYQNNDKPLIESGISPLRPENYKSRINTAPSRKQSSSNLKYNAYANRK